MQNYLKFLQKLPKNLRLKVIRAVDLIAKGKIDGLDIKSLSGYYGVYRCKVGKIRILFQKRDDGNYILDIGFRGGIYEKL